MTPEVQNLTRDFVAQLDAHIAERINTRLRDVLAISFVQPPEAIRQVHRAGYAAASTLPARRRYTRTPKWHAAQKARRKAKP